MSETKQVFISFMKIYNLDHNNKIKRKVITRNSYETKLKILPADSA